MKPILTILVVALALLTVSYAFGADDGRVQRYYNGIRIGTDGSKLSLLTAGQADIDNGSTGTTVTLSSVSVGDIVLVTPNEDLGAAADFYAYATTNSIHLVVNADPETTLTMNYMVIGKD